MAKVAGIRDDNRQRARACLKSSPPDHPARLKVRICVEAGLLADGVPALSLAFVAPSRRSHGLSQQWRGNEHHRSQLRGQPRHRPRSLLSFDKRRRTSKAQGYAWSWGGSMFMLSSVAPVTTPSRASSHTGDGVLWEKCGQMWERACSRLGRPGSEL